MLGVMMSTCLVVIGYYGYNRLNGRQDENRCPVDHS